jgi:hypothetical protein
MKLQYTFTRQFSLWGTLSLETPSEAHLPQDPVGEVTPPALPHMEECTFFRGVKSSWGINMDEKKYL